MLSQETHRKIYFWALAYLFFSVPFMSKWLPFTIGVVILALNFLAEGTFSNGGATVTITFTEDASDYALDLADVASSIRMSLNGVRQSRAVVDSGTVSASIDAENGVALDLS